MGAPLHRELSSEAVRHEGHMDHYCSETFRRSWNEVDLHWKDIAHPDSSGVDCRTLAVHSGGRCEVDNRGARKTHDDLAHCLAEMLKDRVSRMLKRYQGGFT